MKTRISLIYFVTGCRYSTLFGSENYDVVYIRIRYLVSLKSGITYIFSPHFAKIEVDFYDSLATEKILTLHVIILIKSLLNKDENYYYFKTFSEKRLYQLVKK